MESSSIPTSAPVDDSTLAMVAAVAARRGLSLTAAQHHAAAVLDAWLAPRQLLMRDVTLSFLQPIEPGTALRWIDRGGRSAGDVIAP
jgi:hypothetical protein